MFDPDKVVSDGARKYAERDVLARHEAIENYAAGHSVGVAGNLIIPGTGDGETVIRSVVATHAGEKCPKCKPARKRPAKKAPRKK